jgi:uncharacterized membrane protein YeiH
MISIETFIRVLGLGGTFVFAISGALAGVNRRLDILRSDLYAIAALAGASIVVIGHLLGLSYGVPALAGGALCFGLRFMAIRRGWHLPSAHPSAQGRAKADRSNDAEPR